MGNLFTSLLNSATALRTMERQFATIQNNVSNASTPGYVRQTQTVHALSFQPDSGLSGGVAAGPILSARSEYAEETVRRQASSFGAAQQRKTDLAQLEPLFDVSGSTGLPGALSEFFSSFSGLSVRPTDQVSRQDVLNKADLLAQRFHEVAAGLTSAEGAADVSIARNVGEINRLVSEIRAANEAGRQDFRSSGDAGVDADTHAALEELAEMANITVLQDSGGTFNVYLGGSTPLVLGSHQFELQAGPGAVLDSAGNDVSGVVTSGRLGALLEEKSTIAGYRSDLDRLARTVASKVNGLLTSGTAPDGNPGVAMFSCDPATGTAFTFSLTSIAPDEIAAANAGGVNANALALAKLGEQKSIGDYSFSGYFGYIGGQLGRDLANAESEADHQQLLLTQSRTLRAEATGVSLDEEAALLLQVQRQYQAMGTMIRVLDEITDTLISLVR